MKIAENILNIIAAGECTGQNFFLTGMLARKDYMKVNEVLESMGGKWDRKAKAHVFDIEASDAVDQILTTGEVVTNRDKLREFGFFRTPQAIVDIIIERAEIGDGMMVLEPSAGDGAIAEYAMCAAESVILDMYEIQPENCAVLEKKFESRGWWCFAAPGDFLAVEPTPVYDRVVMNPPFAKLADIDHVLHAFKFLKPGGRLVAIMGAGFSFRNDSKCLSFRNFLTGHGAHVSSLPDGSFRESGTGVSTKIVVLDK